MATPASDPRAQAKSTTKKPAAQSPSGPNTTTAFQAGASSVTTAATGNAILGQILGISEVAGTGLVFETRGIPGSLTGLQKTGGLLGFKAVGREAVPGKADTFINAMAKIYEMPENEISAWQDRLFDAGYMPDAVYSKFQKGAPYKTGYVDDDTKVAFRSLYMDAVGYGETKTVAEILAERSARAKSLGGPGAMRGVAGADKPSPGNILKLIKSDPAALREMVQEVSTNLLGRQLDDAERDRLVDMVGAGELAPQQALNQAERTAAGGSDVNLTVTQYDAEARLREKIKAENPEEYQAQGEITGYNVLSDLISEM